MAVKRRTNRLIASNRKAGKAVYGADKKKIGSIKRVMIDKKSGEIDHAVVGFGGFLGIGNDHHTVPWNLLRYDADLGAYNSDISGSRLKGRPKHGTETIFDWNARYAKLDGYHNEVVIRSGQVLRSYPAGIPGGFYAPAAIIGSPTKHAHHGTKLKA